MIPVRAAHRRRGRLESSTASSPCGRERKRGQDERTDGSAILAKRTQVAKTQQWAPVVTDARQRSTALRAWASFSRRLEHHAFKLHAVGIGEIDRIVRG